MSYETIPEPDFDDLINHEPIFNWQIKILRRWTHLPDAAFLHLSAEEADTYIHILRVKRQLQFGNYLTDSHKILRKFGWLPKDRFLEELKKIKLSREEANPSVQVSSLSASVTIQEPNGQITIKRITKKVATI